MRVLLSAYGSRGDVEPMVALAVRLRELGAEVRVCAPPDKEFAELPAGVVHHGGAGTSHRRGRHDPTGRRWPRRCCSTRSAEKGCPRPREPHGIVEPGKCLVHLRSEPMT
ncbi:glycosyltransferase [Sphaerisporangium sp. NBC_01403]|uniref:glycosyltransferase n=1 Tax=Sphaerisporangium sp. NBC_01403 TaxID=2903599 RepID=UPI003250D97C